jgi:hypothetical protein
MDEEVTPAEKVAEDREAAAVAEAAREHVRAEEWEARARVAEQDVRRLRTALETLERTALPRLTGADLVPFDPQADDWPAEAVELSRAIDEEIAAAREQVAS